MNRLFDTTFKEMDIREGRNRTTKGIWVSENTAGNTLLFDIEGSDS